MKYTYSFTLKNNTMSFLNPSLIDNLLYLYIIDLIFFFFFLISFLFLSLDILFKEDKYQEKDYIYDIIFFIFMFSLGYIIGRSYAF